jgi:hypothetical protein
MSAGQAFALILIVAGILTLFWLAWDCREATLDFAEGKFADEFGGDAAHGDHPFIAADDLELISRFHSERNTL